MALINRKKTIVALGHSASGKSCYMHVAISCLFRYGEEFKITKSNTDLDKVADQTEEILSAGKWPDKTIRTNTYQIELSTWAGLAKCEHTLIDWMGETFTEAGQKKPGLQTGSDQDETMKDFVDACKKADGFLLFLDGERLLESGEEINGTRECLYWLKDLIMDNKKDHKQERRFSILITKSDFLERTPEFGTEDSKKIDEKKIYIHIRNKYNSFFKTLESNRYSYLVAPVTCLPVPEHRKENENGTFANKDWKLEDMQKSNIADSKGDMIEPIRWLIKNL